MRPTTLPLTASLAGTLCALAWCAAAPPAADPGPLYAPASAIAPALADAQALPERARPHVRYLSLYNVARADLRRYHAAVAFVLNSLSRSNLMAAPVAVPGTAGRLLRVDLAAYRIDPRAWDDLARKGSGRVPFGDPYFHFEDATVDAPAPAAPAKRTLTGRRAAPRGRTLQAPWLPRKETADLVTLVESDAPVLRADWFIYFALLEPAYHTFLGLDDTEGSFDKLVGVEAVRADEETVEVGSVVLDSEVAGNNRAPFRVASRRRLGRGYKWDSNDFDKSIGAADILQDPSVIKPAASELIGSLPNGLQAYLVVNAQRKRLDRAGIEFAHDNRNGFRSPEVEIRNCPCCHATGIIEVSDDVRGYAAGDVALALRDLGKRDRKKARFIADRYFSASIDDVVTADQQSYGAAVKACNGLAAAANALALRSILLAYEKNRTLADLPAETGYPAGVVNGVLERSGPAGLDHSAVGVLTKKGRVRYDQYASRGHGQLMTLLSRVPVEAPPPAAKGGKRVAGKED